MLAVSEAPSVRRLEGQDDAVVGVVFDIDDDQRHERCLDVDRGCVSCVHYSALNSSKGSRHDSHTKLVLHAVDPKSP